MRVPSVKAPADTSRATEPPPEAEEPPLAPTAPPARSPIKYLKQIWRGEIPLSRVFWQDMVAIGTAVNLAAMGVAFAAVVLGASTPTGIAIHLAPVPYNIFLVAAVWRRADVERSEWVWPAKIAALAWLLIAFVI